MYISDIYTYISRIYTYIYVYIYIHIYIYIYIVWIYIYIYIYIYICICNVYLKKISTKVNVTTDESNGMDEMKPDTEQMMNWGSCRKLALSAS